MFNSKTRTAALDNSPAGATSIIGAGTVITGNIQSNGDIRIDGTLKGNISGRAKILIGPEGIIEGDLEGQQADVLGKVTGMLKVKELLNLRGKASVYGDIYAGKLQIEPTVIFNGQCHMGANIVELNVELNNVINQKKAANQ